MKFRLDKPIGDLAVETVKAAARELSGSAARVPHRSGRKKRGPVGGRLASALRSPERLVRRERWGAVIKWNDLGQSFLFFVRGTKRQKARPVDLAPKERAARAAVDSAAESYFRKRDRRRGKR